MDERCKYSLKPPQTLNIKLLYLSITTRAEQERRLEKEPKGEE